MRPMQANKAMTPVRASAEQTDTLRVLRTQTRLLFSSLPGSLIFTLLLGAILVFSQRGSVSQGDLILWTMMLLVVVVARAWLMRGYRLASHDTLDVCVLWLRRFRLGALAAGIVWGAAALLLFPQHDIAHQSFLAFVLAGVSAGAITSLAIDRLSILALVVPTLVPLIARFVISGDGDEPQLAMASMAALFLVFVVASAARVQRALQANILLEREREEKRRVEENIRRERELFTGGPVVVLVWRPEEGWPVEYVSPNVVAVLGYPPQDLCTEGFRFAELLHRDDAARVSREVTHYMDSGYSHFELSYRLRVARGEYRWFYGFIVPERNPQGEVVRIRGYLFDQSEIRQTQDALERERERLASIIEGTNVGTWEWNIPNGEVVFNERSAEIVGYTLDELAPVSIDTWRRLAHPDDLEESKRLLKQHFSGELEYYEFECRMRHKSGEWVWVMDRGRVATWGANGEPLMMYGTHQDVTGRKRNEEVLTRLSLVASQTTNGVVIADANGLIEWVNEGFSRITGYPLDDVLGKKPGDVLQGADTDQDVVARIRTALAQREPFEAELLNYARDGHSYWVAISCNPLYAKDGTLQGFMAIESDISERKRVERMKSEFISTVSHELRTPLTSISGSLGLLSGGVSGELTPQAQQLVEIARNNSERLTLLINDLLDMEKISAGKLAIEMSSQPLLPSVQQALEENEGYALRHHVSFALTHDEDVNVSVDSHRLQQVLSNLLSNAIKFSPRGGVVRVSMRRKGALVRVSVSDDGPGVPAAFRPHIFGKFSQADSSDSRKLGGTGLGLAITRELVERMGGEIGFDSIEGQGANFWFELPVVSN